MNSAKSLQIAEIVENSIISLHNVSKIYEMGTLKIRALDEFQVDIPKGQLIVILGPSGSGKTTLLNLIGAIDTPTQGQIEVMNQDITKYTRKQLTKFRRDHIGFIFQFFNLIPTLTAEENVEYALQIRGMKNSHERAGEVLVQVGLDQRAHHYPSELSGGEQQRVAIARALAKSPEIILADEPTGELDFETGIKILELLYSLVQKGQTVVIVTHNAEIAKIGHRIIRLRSGKVIANEINPQPIKPSDLHW
jgi:putative ABC transport system ATP-binding protein